MPTRMGLSHPWARFRCVTLIPALAPRLGVAVRPCDAISRMRFRADGDFRARSDTSGASNETS